MMKRFSLFLLMTLLVLSCVKKSTEIHTRSASEAALAEKLTLDIIKQILSIAPDFVVNQGYSGELDIAVLSNPEITNNNYPKTISINYGSGSIGNLGKTRSGIISFTIANGDVKLQDLDVTFDDYQFDGSTIFGSILYQYDSITKGYNGHYHDDGISIVNPNGTMTMKGEFSMKKTSTSGTTSIADDEFNFSCNTTGIDFSQTSFTHITATEHKIKFNCAEFITSGTSNVTPNEKDEQTVDFGGGNCDAQGTISADGKKKNFSF